MTTAFPSLRTTSLTEAILAGLPEGRDVARTDLLHAVMPQRTSLDVGNFEDVIAGLVSEGLVETLALERGRHYRITDAGLALARAERVVPAEVLGAPTMGGAAAMMRNTGPADVEPASPDRLLFWLLVLAFAAGGIVGAVVTRALA